jgi:ABC-2 type transport system ATP-binding protein
MTPLLTAHDLSRKFDKFEALSSTDLELNSGEITTLTGPNGAGKSTLLLCLSGLIRPSTGEISLEGHDLYRDEREARRRLAYVPDVPHFYVELTAWEHLRFIAQAHHVEEKFDQRAEALMRDLNLWDARELFPHNFSRGMRLKLGLAMVLIRPFKVLLLDEPTSALDADSTAQLADRLRNLRAEGVAILLTIHDLALAESLADRRLHIAAGKVEQV